MDPYIDSPSHLLRLAYLRLHRLANRALRPLGVTADQYVLLRILDERGPLSQQELSAASASDPTTVGRILELLEKKKLIARSALRTDRRTRVAKLTAAGRREIKPLCAAAHAACSPLQTAPTAAQVKALRAALAAVNAAFETLERADHKDQS